VKIALLLIFVMVVVFFLLYGFVNDIHNHQSFRRIVLDYIGELMSEYEVAAVDLGNEPLSKAHFYLKTPDALDRFNRDADLSLFTQYGIPVTAQLAD
jgi:hypothetical protein